MGTTMNQRSIWRLAAIGVSVICLSAAVSEIWRDYRSTQDLIRQQTHATAKLAQIHVEQALKQINELFDHLAASLASVSPSDEQAAEKLKSRFQDIIAASEPISVMWLVDAKGEKWVNNHSGSPARSSAAEQDYFIEAFANPDRLIIGSSVKGLMLDRERFVVSHALKTTTGAFSGVLVAGVDTLHFSSLYDNLVRASNVYLVAFNDKGGVIARSSGVDEQGIALAKAALINKDLRVPASDAAQGNELVEQDWIWAVNRSTLYPVTLVAGTRLGPAMSEWHIRAGQDLILGILITFGFLLLAQAGIRAVDREAAVTESLRNLNDNLEERVRVRTQSLHLLLRELNHRIKNNLQIVGSLVRLQSRWHKNPTVAAILDRTHYRIFAIADLYSELEQAQTGSASSRQFFERIARRIVETSEHPELNLELVLDIDDMALIVDQAVPLGLVLNELVTNVVKHAFHDHTNGRIEITFRNHGELVELTVKDNGTSVPGRFRGRGLGRRIVELLVQQLHGSMTIEDRNGRIVCLKAPLRNVESGKTQSYAISEDLGSGANRQDHLRAAE